MKRYGQIFLTAIAIIVGAVVLIYFIDPVGRDLDRYLNEDILEILDEEDRVTEGWKSVSAENYKDDETLLNALQAHVIDDSHKLLQEAEKIVPKTRRIKSAHQLYLSSLNEQHEAFIIVRDAIENNEHEKIKEANKKLANSRKLMDDYIDTINELIKKHNIYIGQ